MRPIYDGTGGADGYISLEVSPELAHDAVGTIAEARRLFAALGRPNILIKVPGTVAGVGAIQALIAEGINVNVTLLFSLKQYVAIADAYLRGLEERVARGQEIAQIASAASFFVSRVDTAVDRALETIGNQALQGKIAIANAKVAYAQLQEILASERWQRLAGHGARVQRQLWASTSTKNPAYPDTLYVDSLIGPMTINTLPPRTLEAYADHGTVAATLGGGIDEARANLDALATVGIDLDEITTQLLGAGVAAFVDSYRELLASIAQKRKKVLG
jgi:transaldolase/glucose-6-phosphate isomerase